MKTSCKNPFVLLLCAAAFLVTPATRAANFNFHLNLSVASLVGNAAGPFSLDFQLNDGSGTLAGVNTVTLTNFAISGGTATGSATLFGTASGSLSSTVTLSDGTNQFNEFYQGFSGGTQSIGFDVSMTNNSDPIAPDQFSVAILDKNLANIPTTAPNSSDALVQVPISSGVGLGNVSTYSSTGSTSGVTATPSAVPEPSTWASIAMGTAALLLLKRHRRH